MQELDRSVGWVFLVRWENSKPPPSVTRRKECASLKQDGIE